jgi:nitrogen fixation NifU-like protein
MALYSDEVMDHFMNPRNVGELDSPDGVGEVGNPVCGDMMTFYITVKDDRIEEVKFKTFGCGAAIAVSSMVSEMAIGKTLDEAMDITNDMVAEELGGLPKNKLHCSNLGADALHAAIEDYRKRLETGEPPEKKPHAHKKTGVDHCPYCETQLDETPPICKSCKIQFVECPSCGKLAASSENACPHCAAELKKDE